VQDRVDRAGDVDVLGHITTDQAKPRMVGQVGDVVRPPGQKVVEAQHVVVLSEESFTQVTPDGPSSPGHDSATHVFPLPNAPPSNESADYALTV
jgi:hypothetical protein